MEAVRIGREVGDLVVPEALGERFQEGEDEGGEPFQWMQRVRFVIIDEDHLAAGLDRPQQGVDGMAARGRNWFRFRGAL